MTYRFIILGFLLVCNQLSLSGQKVEATIVDAKTLNPVDGAFIFISNSSISELSSPDGRFAIDKNGLLSADIVITHLNYETIYLGQHGEDLTSDTIMMEPRAYQLSEVVLNRKNPKKRKKWLKRFTKSILGDTENAKMTRLVNPEVLLFEEKEDTLFAYSDESLILENQKLAYKISFLLKDYALDKNDYVAYRGKLYYDDMTLQMDGKEVEDVLLNRNETFDISSRKFFKEYIAGQYDSINFNIGLSVLRPDGQFQYVGDMERTNILKDGAKKMVHELRFKKFLRIENRNIYMAKQKHYRSTGFGSLSKPSEMQMVIQNKKGSKNKESEFATSYIMSKTDKIVINKEGVIQNPNDIIEYGFWSDLRLANRLPDDFVYMPLKQ